MEELIEAATDQVHEIVASTNREEQSKACDPCQIHNIIQPAAIWCDICDKLLCNDCYKSHRRLKMTRNHQVWSITEINNRKQVNKISDKCEKHKGEELKYFCEDHLEICCNQCFVSKHRSCRKVVCISEVETKESSEFNALQLRLLKLEERVKLFEDKKERNVDITRRQHDEAVAGIKEAGEKLKTLIDTIVNEQIAKAEMTKDDNIRSIDELSRIYKEVEEELTACKSMLAAVKEDNAQLFITTNHLKGEVNVLESKLDDSEQKNTIKEYEFVLNPELTRLLDTAKEIGTLKDTQELNMEKATDEVVDEFEVLRFLRMPIYMMNYDGKQAEAIQMSTDRDIRLLYVLLFPCVSSDTNVELTIMEDGKCLISCTSTHAYTDEDIVAIKVLGDGGVHGLIIQSGHRYDVLVTITGDSSHEGYDSFCGEDGQAVVRTQGVTFSFDNIKASKETSVAGGQIPGFRFECK